MRIEHAHCDVLGAAITRVVDFEGLVDHVICSHYQRSDGTCRLKRAAGTGGPLSRLLERVDDHVAANAPVTCGLR